VFDYLAKELYIPIECIMIFGRSIGSGPAIYLASKRKCRMLILIAAVASIKILAENWIGKIAANLVVNSLFNNIEHIKRV